MFRASSAISELIDVGPRRKIQMTKGFSHRRVARIFCGEERLGSEDTNLMGGPGACSPRKILEMLDCLGLHFAHFHGGERECRVFKRKSQSRALDLLKI